MGTREGMVCIAVLNRDSTRGVLYSLLRTVSRRGDHPKLQGIIGVLRVVGLIGHYRFSKGSGSRGAELRRATRLGLGTQLDTGGAREDDRELWCLGFRVYIGFRVSSYTKLETRVECLPAPSPKCGSILLRGLLVSGVVSLPSGRIPQNQEPICFLRKTLWV